MPNAVELPAARNPAGTVPDHIAGPWGEGWAGKKEEEMHLLNKPTHADIDPTSLIPGSSTVSLPASRGKVLREIPFPFC